MVNILELRQFKNASYHERVMAKQRNEQDPRETAVLNRLLLDTQSGKLQWRLNSNNFEFGFQAEIGGWALYLTADAVKNRDQLIAYSNAPVFLYATKSSLKEMMIFDCEALHDLFWAARQQYIELLQSNAPEFFTDITEAR